MNAQYDWSDLAVFLAVSRHGGASGGARALGIHHATVSRHVARLESALGVRLFERRVQGMDLTELGEELLSHAISMETEVLALERRIAGRDNRPEGIVSVSTVDDFALAIMPDLIRAFRDVYPAVGVELDVRTEHADLARREADVAIRFGAPPQDRGAFRRRIATVDGRLYASESYLRTHPAPTQPEQLSQHDIVRAGSHLKDLPIEGFWNRHTTPDRTAFRSDSMLAQLAAVRAGLGIGWISYFMLQQGDELCPIDLPSPDMSVGLWMVIHADMRQTGRVRAFADFAWKYLTAIRHRFDRTP